MVKKMHIHNPYMNNIYNRKYCDIILCIVMLLSNHTFGVFSIFLTSNFKGPKSLTS